MLFRASAAEFHQKFIILVLCHRNALGQVEIKLEIAVLCLWVVQKDVHNFCLARLYFEVLEIQLVIRKSIACNREQHCYQNSKVFFHNLSI